MVRPRPQVQSHRMLIPLQYATPQRQPLPTALKVVAWLFLGFGVLAAVGLIADFSHGKLNLNCGVLGIFAGPGLLRRRRRWRTCALLLLWLDLVLIPIGIVFLLANYSSPATPDFHGLVVGTVPLPPILILQGMLWALTIWQYRVLTRLEVRALFLPPRRLVIQQWPW